MSQDLRSALLGSTSRRASREPHSALRQLRSASALSFRLSFGFLFPALTRKRTVCRCTDLRNGVLLTGARTK